MVTKPKNIVEMPPVVHVVKQGITNQNVEISQGRRPTKVSE